MSQKVSIVIPIYKVEKYINRCLDSILSQTYSNIEVILVDDGSPDNCGKIADDYASKDNRIKVIHKKNGGLSDARNCGMKHVTGQFTIFVDSDDWLASTMVEKTIKAIVKYNADIVQTAFYYAYDDYLLFDNKCSSKDHPPIILDKQTLMYELVKNEKVKNFAWGKIYKTEIIKDISFVKGVLFEDVFWAHKVMHRTNTYVILNQPMCYYYQRSDSIVSTYTPRNLDILKGLKERHGFIEEYYKDLSDDSYKLILKTSLIHYKLLLLNRKEDKGGLYKREIKLYIKDNYLKLKKAVENDKHLRNQLLLFKIHPSLCILFLIANKISDKIRLTLTSEPSGFERIDCH